MHQTLTRIIMGVAGAAAIVMAFHPATRIHSGKGVGADPQPFSPTGRWILFFLGALSLLYAVTGWSDLGSR